MSVRMWRRFARIRSVRMKNFSTCLGSSRRIYLSIMPRAILQWASTWCSVESFSSLSPVVVSINILPASVICVLTISFASELDSTARSCSQPMLNRFRVIFGKQVGLQAQSAVSASHVAELLVLAAQAGERQRVALEAVAWPAQKDAVGYVVETAVASRGVVIQFQIARVVKPTIASLALGSFCSQQVVQHLFAAQLLSWRFVYALYGLEAWHCVFCAISAGGRFCSVRNLPLGDQKAAHVTVWPRQKTLLP